MQEEHTTLKKHQKSSLNILNKPRHMAIITITYLLFTLLSSLLFKRSNILCCGLFGGSGTLDLTVIKLLGFANDSRGGDGTGFYYNDEIKRGVNQKAKFVNFVKDEGIKETKSKVFLGHTRKSSSGGNLLKNTHPFLIDEMLVLTHNGTIYNIDELCEKYDVDKGTMDVDSQILAKIILERGFEVLNDYIGYAALAFCFRNKPDEIYLYHGMSQEKPYTTGYVKNPEEERPLFYMQTKNALYYSSLDEPLLFLKEEDSEVVKLPHNKIFKIRNGKFVANWIHEVDRLTTNYDVDDYRFPTRTTTYNNNHKSVNTTSSPRKEVPKLLAPKKEDAIGDSDKDICLIHHDDMYDGKLKRLFFYKGRWRITDSTCVHPLLAQRIIFADKHTQKWCYPSLEESTKQLLEKEIEGEKVTLKPYYFHEGVMLRNKQAYNTISRKLEDPRDPLYLDLHAADCNFARAISVYSKYPVTLAPADSIRIVGKDRAVWFYEGKPCNFTGQKPQFANVKLTIKDGALKKMEYINHISGSTEVKFKEEFDASGKSLFEIQDILSLPELLLRAFDCYIRFTHGTFDQFVENTPEQQEKILEKSKEDIYFTLLSNNETIYQYLSRRTKLNLVEFLEQAEEQGETMDIHFESPIKTEPKVFYDPAQRTIYDMDIDTQPENKIIDTEAMVLESDEDDDINEEEFIFDDEADVLLNEFILENPLRDVATELTVLQNSEFAQEAALFLFLQGDVIMKGLQAICKNHKKTDLIVDIQNILK